MAQLGRSKKSSHRRALGPGYQSEAVAKASPKRRRDRLMLTSARGAVRGSLAVRGGSRGRRRPHTLGEGEGD